MARIAVVNDDTQFLEMMAAVLEEMGWETAIYRESNNAFLGLKQSPPDLIILDIRMEGREAGWNLLELLTLDRAMSSIPVVVCSAAVDDLRSHEAWLREHGIAILPKPFDIPHLYRQVEASLAGPQTDA